MLILKTLLHVIKTVSIAKVYYEKSIQHEVCTEKNAV